MGVVLNVAAYCRVSTDKEDQANSLASQRSYFEEFISNHAGWALYKVYYDEGISGTQTARRQGFLDMVEDAMLGRVDLILTKEVSRFARNTVDTLAFTRKLKAAGVGVIFTIDNIDTRDSDGELRLTIMASIAQEESRKTSERVRWGQKRRMEQGVVFGRDMLGYIITGGKMYVNQEEAAIVRAIFHKYTNEGKGTCVIARELLEEGMKPQRVKKWSNTMILKVLRNEKYVGDLCQKKTFTPDYLTHAKKYNRGEEEVVYLRDHHEAIIDRNLWERTQRELKHRAPKTQQSAKHNNRYWYSGRLYCGECGARFVSRTQRRKDGSIYRAFRCGKSAKEGGRKLDGQGEAAGCSNVHISERTLLACLSFVVGHIQVNQEKVKQEIRDEIRSIRDNFKDRSDNERLEQELQKLQEKKSRAVDLMINGVITQEELVRQKQWYDDKILILQKRQEQDKMQVEIRNRQLDSMEQYMEELDRITSCGLNNEYVYREVLDKIVINKNHTLEIYLNCVPFPMCICYRSYGKGESYTTEIVCMEIPVSDADDTT